jgi:MoxR-like ATPase
LPDSRNIHETIERLRDEMSRVLVGQKRLVDRLLIGLATGGHLLLEGAPGLAKTLAAHSLAQAVGLSFQRIQFTPDLLPADLLGSEVFQPATGGFSVRRGPVFANLLLADEINRAPAKVQSALLEAMQEKQVTIGTETSPLPNPFLVLATQNPIEHQGTYPLAEAQLDRFLMKVLVDYPDRDEERTILRQIGRTAPQAPAKAVVALNEVKGLHAAVDEVHLEDKLADYIVDLVRATRKPADYRLDLEGKLDLGASPRATIALALAARAQAILAGRDYVTPQDVKEVAPDVLRHRLILSFEAEAEGLDAEKVIAALLAGIAVP